MRRLLEMVRRRRIDLTPLLTHRFALADIERAYALFGSEPTESSRSPSPPEEVNQCAFATSSWATTSPLQQTERWPWPRTSRRNTTRGWCF